VLQIDNGYVYTTETDGTVTNQFTNNTLDVDYYHHTILEFFTQNGNRCIGSTPAHLTNLCRAVPALHVSSCKAPAGGESRLVSIASSNDNGGSSPYYLQTRSTSKGSYMSTDTVINGRYTEWGV
jgi:hypothetical protein